MGKSEGIGSKPKLSTSPCNFNPSLSMPGTNYSVGKSTLKCKAPKLQRFLPLN